MTFTLTQLPVLLCAFAAASFGLVALTVLLANRARLELGLYAILAFVLSFSLAAPLFTPVPFAISPHVLARVQRALSFALPAIGYLFLLRFLSLPLVPGRAALLVVPAIGTVLSFLIPADNRLIVSLAVLSFLQITIGLFLVLAKREYRRRDTALVFVATAVLILGVLAEAATERQIFAWRFGLPLLGGSFLLFTALLLPTVADQERRLFARATTDSLTNLLNRPAFLDRGRDEIVRAERTGRAFAVVMIDIDHFKLFNDRFGHQAGDQVLAACGQAIAKTVRGIDVAARYGGEEFVVLLVEVDEANAKPAVERIRAAIGSLGPPRLPDKVTASFGIAIHHGLFERSQIEGLIHRADAALYESKRNGRDRITLEKTPPGTSPAQLKYR